MSVPTLEQSMVHQPPNGDLVHQPSPLDLLQQALKQGVSLDQMDRFQAMYERHEANQARKAFVEAMSAFKSHDIHITKDKTNSQYKSKYVSLGNLIATVTPFLSQHGLSCRWDIDQSSDITVTCIITHAMGHSESVSMTCPPDKSGSKNPIQEIKSAITYAKACTFESICGLASSDANVDTDGNSQPSQKAALAEELVVQRLDAIKNSRDDADLKKFYLVALKEAQAAGDQSAQDDYGKAKNNRYRELHTRAQ